MLPKDKDMTNIYRKYGLYTLNYHMYIYIYVYIYIRIYIYMSASHEKSPTEISIKQDPKQQRQSALFDLCLGASLCNSGLLKWTLQTYSRFPASFPSKQKIYGYVCCTWNKIIFKKKHLQESKGPCGPQNQDPDPYIEPPYMEPP